MNSKVNELAKLWISDTKAERFEDSEILHMLIDLPFEDPHKTADFISSVLVITDDRDVLGALAVGPLEDLISYHPKVATILEEKEKDNPKFKDCLSMLRLK